MSIKIITFVLLGIALSSPSQAKLSDRTNSPSRKSEDLKLAGDYTDLVCQLTIEGNLGSLNKKIESGQLGSKASVKALLDKLSVPYGKGCVISVLGSLSTQMKKKGIVDHHTELTRIIEMSDKAKMIGYLKKEYPALSHEESLRVSTFLEALNRPVNSPERIRTGDASSRPAATAE